jgi:hypothetical protein
MVAIELPSVLPDQGLGRVSHLDAANGDLQWQFHNFLLSL